LVGDATDDAMRREDLATFLKLGEMMLVRLRGWETDNLRRLLIRSFVAHWSDRRNGEANNIS